MQRLIGEQRESDRLFCVAVDTELLMISDAGRREPHSKHLDERFVPYAPAA